MKLTLALFPAAAAALSCLVAPASAGSPEIYTGRFSDLAVGGYDAVAYFEDGKPVKGSKEFSYEYEDATWLFASADNLEQFKEDPDAFAPQYGGYCAWAVAQGYTAPGNPKNWSVRGGKLYLNYDNGVQAKWLKDPDGFITKADANWPAVLDK
jgi:YHS domain-containing protein